MFSRILSIVAVVMATTALIIALRPNEKPYEEPKHEYPILEAMGYYQRFSHKLWLALEKKNWELAEFYAHELEEVTEEFVESNVIDEGMQLSNYAQNMLTPAIADLDKAIDKKDAVLADQSYRALVNSCNACHSITKHAYIKIVVPDSVRPYNQDFSR